MVEYYIKYILNIDYKPKVQTLDYFSSDYGLDYRLNYSLEYKFDYRLYFRFYYLLDCSLY